MVLIRTILYSRPHIIPSSSLFYGTNLHHFLLSPFPPFLPHIILPLAIYFTVLTRTIFPLPLAPRYFVFP